MVKSFINYSHAPLIYPNAAVSWQIDLWNIQQVFQQKYNKALWQMVESDTSGDYRRLLVAIIGRN